MYRRQLARPSAVLAMIAAVLGVVVMAGWLTQDAGLVTVYPGLPSMGFNTALCFILFGFALLMATLEANRSRAVLLVPAFLVVVISGLRLSEILTGLPSGWGQLLLSLFVPRTFIDLVGGGMGPNTSLSFLIGGCALVFDGMPVSNRYRHVVLEFSGLAMLALGFVSLSGYVAALEAAYRWSPLAGMALHTSLGMVIAGVSIVLRDQRMGLFESDRVPLWVPGFLCIFALLFDLYTPLGVAAGILYVPLVACAFWFSDRAAPFFLAVVCTLLIGIGYFASVDEGVAFWKVMTNRALSVGTIWIVAVLVYWFRKTSLQLAEEQVRFSALVRSTPDGVISIDERGTIRSFNPAAEAMFGFKAAHVIGRNIKMLMPEPYHSEHDGYLDRHMRTGERRIIGTNREVSGLRSDGSSFPLDLSVSAVETGAEKTFVGIVRDITERRRQEDELRTALANLNEREQRLSAVLRTAVDGIIAIDENYLVRHFNPAAERIFGYRSDEVLGKNVNMLMPEPYHTAHDGYVSAYMQTGEKKIIGVGREVQGKRKDGTVFPLDLAVSEVPLGGGERAFVGMVRDISDRKRQEEQLTSTLGQLEVYAADLERSNQELDDFAYIASHDLKEPLRGLHNHSRFLQEDYEELLDEDGKRRINRLIFLSQRMERLVNDLLYFSRIGRQELAVKPTDMGMLVQDVVSTLEDFLQERGAKVDISANLPVYTCDSVRVAEAFRNLITNAVKYNDKQDKRVEVGFLARYNDASGRNASAVFYVRDNGKGIAPEFFSDVFRIFKRLEKRDDGDEGTGSGLTFVKKIVGRHHGDIWLTSEIGVGTTFYFTLGSDAHEQAAA
jgi:PAS domain S-box-containing protein